MDQTAAKCILSRRVTAEALRAPRSKTSSLRFFAAIPPLSAAPRVPSASEPAHGFDEFEILLDSFPITGQVLLHQAQDL